MRLVFIGTGEIGVPTLQALLKSPKHTIAAVITQPDRPTGRHQKLSHSPIKQTAFSNHIKIFQPENINASSSTTAIKYMQPDAIIVCAYGQILKRELLKLPRLGCLNIHASLLPLYRGSSCIQAAILNGDKETGITIMKMDEGLDTGPVIDQKSLPIKSKDTAGSLHDRLAKLAPKILLKTLDSIAKSKFKLSHQDHHKASVVKKLTKQSGQIDWNQPQIIVDRHIRAMSPWPSAFTYIQENEEEKKMLKIFSTIISNRASGAPGKILKIDKHGILVACSKGGLLLREVQLEGKKQMSVEEFIRGYKLEPGSTLL